MHHLIMMSGRPHRGWIASLSGAAVLAFVLLMASGRATRAPRTPGPAPSTYEIVNAYPHDPNAYTQGLYFENGFLFEGTGRYGQSSLRKVELATGRVVRQVDLPLSFFGEGIAAFGGSIYQLTWRSGVGFIYDRKSFARQGRFRFHPEGWGLTRDGRHLIMSDGSASLRVIDPESRAEIRRIAVHDASGPIDRLNELEMINGQIWANVWHRDEIVRIDPASGSVAGRVDLSSLLADGRPSDPEGVLNGIAYDAQGDRLFVTGKLWPRVFEIRVVP